jgi:hypothetical protein
MERNNDSYNVTVSNSPFVQGENNLVILVTVRQKTMGLEQNGTYDDSLSRCGR